MGRTPGTNQINPALKPAGFPSTSFHWILVPAANISCQHYFNSPLKDLTTFILRHPPIQATTTDLSEM